MKQTFSLKYYDWILIAVSLIFSIDAVSNLFSEFEFFSSYSIRIIIALVSILAFISLVVNNINGERHSRFFIVIALLMPAVLILNLFFTDLIFYGVNRLDLLQNANLFIKLIIGVVLFVLSIKYSNQAKSDRRKDYGILTLSIGVYVILFSIIRAIQAKMLPELNEFPIWKVIVKPIIGLIITYFGFILMNDKIKLRTSLLVTLILIYIYGLI